MHISISSIMALAAIVSIANSSPLASVTAPICGVIPTGTQLIQSINQMDSIADALACHDLCLNTANCQSLMFGLLDGSLTCSLFSVAVSELAPVEGLLAFDITCPISSLDVSVNASTAAGTADLPALPISDTEVNAGVAANDGMLLKAKKREEPVVVPADIAGVVIANVTLEVPSLKNCAGACQELDLCEGFELVGQVCQLLGGAETA